MATSKYDECRQAYLEWLLTPPGERNPETKTEFAESWDINRSTLYEWEKSDSFQAELRKVKSLWGTMWYGEIIGKLMEIVRDRNDGVAVQAGKELLRHLEVETPSEQGDLSDDDFASLKAALQKAGWQVKE